MTVTTANAGRAAAFNKLRNQFLPETAACVFVFMMTNQMGGSLGVVIQLGFFGLLIAARPTDCLQIFLRWWPLLAAPIIAFISFTWSDLPAVSARYGFQLLFTAFAGVLIANMLPAYRFVHMIFLSMLVFCIVSIMSRRMGPAIDGLVLVGLTGSKNQMALAAYTLLVSAIATGLLRQTPPWMRAAAAAGILIGLFVLAITKSASALVLTGIAVPGLLAIYLTQKMTPAARMSILIVAVIVTIPIIFLAPEIEEAINYFLFNTLGKDPTLTGRTQLWAYAQEMIARRPVQGYGYQSFWLGDSLEVLSFLHGAGVGDPRSFHFHNTYLQIGVDIGYVGMIAFAGAMIAILFGGMRQYVLNPTTSTTFAFVMFLGIAVLSFTELVMAPMLPRTLFLYAFGVYLLAKPPPPAAPPPQRVYRKSWAHA